MNLGRLLAAVAAVAAVVLLVWAPKSDVGPTARPARKRSRGGKSEAGGRHNAALGPLSVVATSVAAAGLGWWLTASVLLGLAVGMVAGSSVHLVVVMVRVRTEALRLEGLTTFTALLARQLLTAPTTAVGITQAASSITSGPVAGAVHRFAEVAASRSVAAGAEAFELELGGHPVARRLARITSGTEHRGSPSVDALDMLARVVSQQAGTVRHCQRLVTGEFPTLIVSVWLAVAMLAASNYVSVELAYYWTSAEGELLLVMSGALFALGASRIAGYSRTVLPVRAPTPSTGG